MTHTIFRFWKFPFTNFDFWEFPLLIHQFYFGNSHFSITNLNSGIPSMARSWLHKSLLRTTEIITLFLWFFRDFCGSLMISVVPIHDFCGSLAIFVVLSQFLWFHRDFCGSFTISVVPSRFLWFPRDISRFPHHFVVLLKFISFNFEFPYRKFAFKINCSV